MRVSQRFCGMHFDKEIKFMRYKAGYSLFGHRRNDNIFKFNNDPSKTKLITSRQDDETFTQTTS
jgi:hypothetical protein